MIPQQNKEEEHKRPNEVRAKAIMAKHAKKKWKGDHKGKQSSSLGKKITSELGSDNLHSPPIEVGKNRELCPHIERGITLDKLSEKLNSSISHNCEDCRITVGDKRAKKGKGKTGKKGGNSSSSESKAIWICLCCGHFSCGGVGLPTTPQSHALRHAKQNHHPLVVHHENHQLIWCFQCNKLIHYDKSEDNENKDVLHEAVKILKDVTADGSSVDVEDIWFGKGIAAIDCDSSDMSANGKSAFLARGLVNLGNTCFFNSILQNLLAINKLRDYFFRLEESLGPITTALKKLFFETRHGSGSRGTIDPKSLLGSLCSKAPQFKGYQQHDSHELLRYLLESLSVEELNSRKVIKSSHGSTTDSSFVDTIFGGQLSSTVSCLKCGHASTIYETFLDISLPVPTKKPPSKPGMLVTRGKKKKLPPKRSGNNLSKLNRPAYDLHGENLSDKRNVDGHDPEVRSVFQPEDQSMAHSDNFGSSGSIFPENIALDMGLTTDDFSVINDPKENLAVASTGELTLDSFSWMDYVGLDEASDEKNEQDVEHLRNPLGNLTVLDHLETTGISDEIQDDVETDNISTYKCAMNEKKSSSDVSMSLSLCHITESNAEDAPSVNIIHQSKASSLPCENLAMENFHPLEDMKKAIIDFSECGYPGDLFAEKVAQLDANVGHSTESWSKVLDDSAKAIENAPEVLDLPLSKDVASSDEMFRTETESSSALIGDNQDFLDFNGFGDLFNEPEVFLESKPSDRSVSDTSNIMRTEITGDSSESDPNEVDNNDPVSVESCIACFIKPEHLSKDEHAWQCDNCSKVLQEKMKSKKKIQMATSDLPSYKDENSMNEIIEQGAIDSSGVSIQSPDIDIHVPTEKCVESDVGTTSLYTKSQRTQTTDSLHGVAVSSSSINQTGSLSHEDYASDEDQSSNSKIRPSKHESDECNQKLLNIENTKVKRDATKTILINKAPSILTIHLKRFSQDVRGRLSKLNGHVSFREIINLNPYMDPRCTVKDTLAYRLVGVVEHSGTMRYGHYIAYVRGTKNNGECVWYYASDAHIRETSFEEVLRCEAYILFYEAI